MHKLGKKTPRISLQQRNESEQTYTKFHQWTATRGTEFTVKHRAAAVVHLVDRNFVLTAFECERGFRNLGCCAEGTSSEFLVVAMIRENVSGGIKALRAWHCEQPNRMNPQRVLQPTWRL